MTFAVLLVLAIALGQFQNRARASGTSDPISSLTRKLVTPGVAMIDSAKAGTDAFWAHAVNASKSEIELRRLKQLEATYKVYAQTVEALRGEIDQLRKLAGMPNFGRDRVPARITGYYPNENRITLSAGEHQGIKVGMPVVSAQGLVGIVQTVESDKSQLLTVTSPVVRYGATVVRDLGVPGLMKGQTPTRLVLDVLDTGKIEVGDSVVTSGFSNRIPRGIPVGTVAEVVPDPSYGTRRVFVAPHVQIGPTLEVWILK